MNLLVSVRSAEEAEAALAGGAALIDVKEPARGALGRADDATLQDVAAAVAGRRPVSAALGELKEASNPPTFPVAYVKWGLSRCAGGSGWRAGLDAAAARLPAATRPVAVAYADWRRADAPAPADVCAFARDRAWGAFLLDTWRKDGTTLLDWLSLAELKPLRDACRDAGVPLALAGSLGPEQIATLLPLRPDWFAVRGAACARGKRDGRIDAAAVRRLAALLTGATPASSARAL